MGKMARLPSRLAALPSRLAAAPDDRRERGRYRDAQPWRAWYKTARWQALRWATLLRDLFTCQHCQRVEADTSKLVADHRKAHRGDEALFWDPDNLWTLCKTCHDSWKQRQERSDAAEGDSIVGHNGGPRLDRR